MTSSFTRRTLTSATSRHPRPGAVTRKSSRPRLGLDQTGVRAWPRVRDRSAARSCRGGAGANPGSLLRARGRTRTTPTRAALAGTGASAPRTRSPLRTCTRPAARQRAGTPPARCRRWTARCACVTGRCLLPSPPQTGSPVTARVRPAGRRPLPGAAGSCRAGAQLPGEVRPACRHRPRRSVCRHPVSAGDGTAARVSARGLSPRRVTLAGGVVGVYRGHAEPGQPSAGCRASLCVERDANRVTRLARRAVR